MGDERRRSPRVVIDVPARLTVAGEVIAGRVRDICRDAVLIEADQSFPLQTVIALEAEIPGVAGTMRALGRVIRLAPSAGSKHGMAILFAELSSESRMRIDLFVSEQET